MPIETQKLVDFQNQLARDYNARREQHLARIIELGSPPVGSNPEIDTLSAEFTGEKRTLDALAAFIITEAADSVGHLEPHILGEPNE